MPFFSFLLRVSFVVLVLTLVRKPTDGLAQGYLSEQERFVVDQFRGCAPLKVEVVDENIPDGNTSNPIYNFNYGGSLSGNIFFDENQDYDDTTYTVPGTYKILQVIGDVFDSVTIEVLEPRPPQFRVYNCINNSIYLEVTEPYYDRLQIDFGDGITIETSATATTYAYGGPERYTISVRGIFEDADSQNCAVADTTITTILGLTEATLTAVTVESGTAVRVNYQLPNPHVSYRLEVAEAGSDDFSLAQFDLDGGEEFVADDPIFNTQEQSYCFRVVAVNRCDEDRNIPSERLCSIALQAEAQDLQNQLAWASEGFTNYQVSRGGTVATTTTDTEYLDTDVVCQQAYQYQVVAETATGTSRSEVITLTAGSEAIAVAPDSVTLQVSGQQFQLVGKANPEATQYYVYRSTEEQNPVRYDSLNVQDSVITIVMYEDANVEVGERYCYQLSYVDVCGNESERSEPVCATLPTQGEVHFPNAFTPNGDGMNDVFVYTSTLIEQLTLQIYNRWGELVFQTNQLDVGWDGTYQGSVAPQGTYLYKTEVVDQLGNRFVRQGRFVLLHR